jgi:hypothetical protein
VVSELLRVREIRIAPAGTTPARLSVKVDGMHYDLYDDEKSINCHELELATNFGIISVKANVMSAAGSDDDTWLLLDLIEEVVIT